MLFQAAERRAPSRRNQARGHTSYQETAKGRLRCHLRTTVGNHVIVPALPRFLAEYPDVTLDVTLTDERADLVALGIDVAVWLGQLEDSSPHRPAAEPESSRSTGSFCASSSYLAQHGRPESPDDLAEHNCLVYRAKHYDNRWRFVKDGERIEVSVSGNLETDSGTVLFTSAVNGLGLIIIQNTAQEALARGELVPARELRSQCNGVRHCALCRSSWRTPRLAEDAPLSIFLSHCSGKQN